MESEIRKAYMFNDYIKIEKKKTAVETFHEYYIYILFCIILFIYKCSSLHKKFTFPVLLYHIFLQ